MSWEQLKDILDESRDILRQHQAARPTVCPNDAVLLLEGPSGVLYCPFDGWREGDGDPNGLSKVI